MLVLTTRSDANNILHVSTPAARFTIRRHKNSALVKVFIADSADDFAAVVVPWPAETPDGHVKATMLERAMRTAIRQSTKKANDMRLEIKHIEQRIEASLTDVGNLTTAVESLKTERFEFKKD